MNESVRSLQKTKKKGPKGVIRTSLATYSITMFVQISKFRLNKLPVVDLYQLMCHVMHWKQRHTTARGRTSVTHCQTPTRALKVLTKETFPWRWRHGVRILLAFSQWSSFQQSLYFSTRWFAFTVATVNSLRPRPRNTQLLTLKSLCWHHLRWLGGILERRTRDLTSRVWLPAMTLPGYFCV